MKIAIWGASGYIAKTVIAELSSKGHEIFLIFRDDQKRNANDKDNLTCVTVPTREIRSALLEIKPDLVLNMSNYFVKTQTTEDVARFSEVNCQVVTEIAYGCVETGASLLHIGSAWQATFAENDSSLGNVYGLYKGLAIKIIEWFCMSFQLNAIVLNLYDTYGPNDPRGKIVQFLVDQIGAEVPLDLSGGAQILELVHISDVATAITSAIELEEKKRENNETSNQQFSQFWCYPKDANTLKEIVEIINELSEVPINVNWGARPYRVGEKFQREISNKPLVPGWNQSKTLKEGLSEIIGPMS